MQHSKSIYQKRRGVNPKRKFIQKDQNGKRLIAESISCQLFLSSYKLVVRPPFAAAGLTAVLYRAYYKIDVNPPTTAESNFTGPH